MDLLLFILDYQLGEPYIQCACSPRTVSARSAFLMPSLPFVYVYPSTCPRAHCTPNKSVPTLRYTRRQGPIYTGPCPKALTECSPLTTNKHLLVSRQFSGPFGVTKYGSGLRNDVVNQCLECALHRDVGTATPSFSGWYGAHRHPIRSVYSAVRFNGSLFLYTPVRCVLVA